MKHTGSCDETTSRSREAQTSKKSSWNRPEEAKTINARTAGCMLQARGDSLIQGIWWHWREKHVVSNTWTDSCTGRKTVNINPLKQTTTTFVSIAGAEEPYQEKICETAGNAEEPSVFIHIHMKKTPEAARGGCFVRIDPASVDPQHAASDRQYPGYSCFSRRFCQAADGV